MGSELGVMYYRQHMYVCRYVSMYVCMYVGMYVRMYVCLYVCMYLVTFLCISNISTSMYVVMHVMNV